MPLLEDYVMKIFYKLGMAVKNLKWRIQRFKRGYADVDVWDIDCWFMNIIPKMLKQLRDTTHSAPMLIDEGANDENRFRIWNGILNKMIYLAKEMNEETCSYKNEYEEEFFKYIESRDLSSDENGRLPLEIQHELKNRISERYCEQEKTIARYREICKNRFFKLFSKYFYDLWD